MPGRRACSKQRRRFSFPNNLRQSRRQRNPTRSGPRFPCRHRRRRRRKATRPRSMRSSRLPRSTPPKPPPPPQSPLPPEPAPPSPSFEERFGASWVVWIGGIALALGGIFMVQFSIEAGLIGPGVRIFLGGLLAAALIAAGEWTRRREFVVPLANVPTAHIPSILTAAGTTV